MAGNRIPGTVFSDIQGMQALLGGLGFKLITRLGFKGASALNQPFTPPGCLPSASLPFGQRSFVQERAQP